MKYALVTGGSGGIGKAICLKLSQMDYSVIIHYNKNIAAAEAIQKEIWNLTVEPEIKVKLTEKTGEAEFRIVEGSDPFIQLQSLLASLHLIL